MEASSRGQFSEVTDSLLVVGGFALVEDGEAFGVGGDLQQHGGEHVPRAGLGSTGLWTGHRRVASLLPREGIWIIQPATGKDGV